MESHTIAPKPIVAIGASVRYACLSLRRAGYSCEGIDLFADTETRLAGPTQQCREYPTSLFRRLAERQNARWIFTGGMENYPQLVAEAAQRSELLGATPSALSTLRDPFKLSELVADCPIRLPPITHAIRGDRSEWLAKSARSCGGLGVCRAVDSIDHPIDQLYFQKFVRGECLGVVFAAQSGACRLLGVTQALDTASEPWIGGRRFMYGGSIGPIALTQEERIAMDQLGQRLASVPGLVGVIGVDLIRDEQGRLHLIDVNPRLPASAEVLERATRTSIAGLHVRCCLNDDAASEDAALFADKIARSDVLVGKAVVYAMRDSQASTQLRELAADNWQAATSHWLCDTPAEDQTIELGHPIATVFAEGARGYPVTERLAEYAARVRSLC